jgi:hypothetical protein
MSLASVLSGTPAALAVSQLGVPATPVSSIVARGSGAGLTITETQPVGSVAGVVLSASTLGADASLSLQSTAAGPSTTRWQWFVPGTNGGGLVAGNLQLYRYVNDVFNAQSIRVGTDGVVEFPDTTQCGRAVIPAGNDEAPQVPNLRVTASSVIVCSANAVDATAGAVSAVIAPGAGFTITSAANAAADLSVSWFIARY